MYVQRLEKGARNVRYRYLSYKYTRRARPDAVFQGAWDSFGAWPSHAAITWRPPTDIYETRDEIIIVLELAGVTEEDLSVTLFTDLLVVEGRREQPVTDISACHQLGIKYGDFRTEIALHRPVKHETINAEYRHGLLKITLQKLD
jgi:HSP20 family protein